MATVTVSQVIDFLDGITDLSFLDKAHFDAIGEELLLNAEARFDKEVAPDGTPWTPISKQHKKRKQKLDYGDKILHMRGHLKDLLRYQSTDSQVQFGSNLKYANLHQYGGRFKAFGKHRATMPARPFIANKDGSVSDADRQSIKEVVEEAWVEWVARNS